MITGMNHTGFVVKDLEKSKEFYRDIMGFTVAATREREGGPISSLIGYENTHLKIAHLSVGDGPTLELIQYVHPPGTERQSSERNIFGASHLAFNVDDIEQVYRRMIDHGAQKLHTPVEMQPGRKACYLQDPDGNWIELIQAE